MDGISELISHGVEELLGRASGPLHLRLVFMPTVVTVLAIRAGVRDARAGRPAFLWGVLTSRAQRRPLLRAAVRDLGRVFLFACVLDTVYQLVVLRAFHPVQVLIVAVACAIAPYALVRGPATRLWRARSRASAQPPPT